MLIFSYEKPYGKNAYYDNTDNNQKKIIIGSAFVGVEVLNNLQKEFKRNKRVGITIISKDSFFVFTSMLPEVTTGIIGTCHIETPIRLVCNFEVL